MYSELIEHFRWLSERYGSPRYYRLDGFYQAHVDMFHLAQAIGTIYAPEVQKELNTIRREVMHQLVDQAYNNLGHADGIMAPTNTRIRSNWTWEQYQITPEVAVDPGLAWRIVNRRLLTKLNKALKNQITCVKRKAGI